MVCKISAILSLLGCVNTLWQRQSDLYFEDNIFNFISNFRWNLNKIYKFTYLKWQSCFGCNALRARQNGTPFKTLYSNKFSCMELFHYFIFSCDQAALWMVFSVRLSVGLSVCPSVCLSVCPSVTPFWLCSHHRIIMKFSGVITLDQGKVHAKGQSHRSKVKVTEVTTQLFVSGL